MNTALSCYTTVTHTCHAASTGNESVTAALPGSSNRHDQMEQTAISNSELGDNEGTWYYDQNQFILMMIIELLAPTENEYPILTEREQLLLVLMVNSLKIQLVETQVPVLNYYRV